MVHSLLFPLWFLLHLQSLHCSFHLLVYHVCSIWILFLIIPVLTITIGFIFGFLLVYFSFTRICLAVHSSTIHKIEIHHFRFMQIKSVCNTYDTPSTWMRPEYWCSICFHCDNFIHFWIIQFIFISLVVLSCHYSTIRNALYAALFFLQC